jgi:hypothetical protein
MLFDPVVELQRYACLSNAGLGAMRAGCRAGRSARRERRRRCSPGPASAHCWCRAPVQSPLTRTSWTAVATWCLHLRTLSLQLPVHCMHAHVLPLQHGACTDTRLDWLCRCATKLRSAKELGRLVWRTGRKQISGQSCQWQAELRQCRGSRVCRQACGRWRCRKGAEREVVR